MNEANLNDIIILLWKHKRKLMLMVGFGLIISILDLHMSTYKYTISYNITPAEPSTLSSGPDISSFIGMGVSGSSNENFELFKEGLTSEFAAAALYNDTELTQEIFSNQWDSKQKKWTPNVGVISVIKNSIKYVLGFPVRPWRKPSVKDLHEYLIKNIEVNQPIDSSIATFSIETSDIAFGKRLLILLHSAVDNILRNKASIRKLERIEFLKMQIAKATVQEYKLSLVSNLAEETKGYMSTQGTVAFAAEPFGAPEASFNPTSPVPKLILLSFPIAFFIFGVFLVIVRARPWDKG